VGVEEEPDLRDRARGVFLLRQVAGLLEDLELAPRDQLVVPLGDLARHQPVAVADEDQGWRADLLHLVGTILRDLLVHAREEGVEPAVAPERCVVGVDVSVGDVVGIVDGIAEAAAGDAAGWQRAQHRPDDRPRDHADEERGLARLGERQAGGVDQHQRRDPVGMEDRGLGHHVTAHRVADQHRPADLLLVEIADHEARQPVGRVGRIVGLVAEAEPREVDRVHAIVLGERVDHLPPAVGARRIAVDEHEVAALALGDGEQAVSRDHHEPALAGVRVGAAAGELRGRHGRARGEDDEREADPSPQHGAAPYDSRGPVANVRGGSGRAPLT
jgi:hypothetical protein